nr:unnamed protein product [Callosobruchus chinensis]
MDFAVGGAAAMGASIFSNPFDVLKTRMQLQGELRARGHHPVHYRNVVHAAWVIAREEGLSGLQKGLGPAMIMHGIRNSARLGIYQLLHKSGHLTDEEGKTVLHRSAIASAVSGAAGAFLGSPLFLVKTQLQSQAAESLAVGTQHGHKGAIDALMSIYRKFGIVGLWRGVDATMLRAVVGSSAQLSSFAKVKDSLNEYEFFRRNQVVSSLIASIIGGIFQTLFMQPFDLVSTRLYNQPVDKHGKGVLYNGIVDCFIRIGRSEGITGFYKGVTANYMRLAPHGALCLVFWDILKNLQVKYYDRAY